MATGIKTIGMLSRPVIFEVEEGPDPGVQTEVTPTERVDYRPEAGLSPVVAIVGAGLLIVGAFWGLRRVME